MDTHCLHSVASHPFVYHSFLGFHNISQPVVRRGDIPAKDVRHVHTWCGRTILTRIRHYFPSRRGEPPGGFDERPHDHRRCDGRDHLQSHENKMYRPPPQVVRFVLPTESSRAFDDGVVASLWRKGAVCGSTSKRSFIVPIVDAL